MEPGSLPKKGWKMRERERISEFDERVREQHREESSASNYSLAGRQLTALSFAEARLRSEVRQAAAIDKSLRAATTQEQIEILQKYQQEHVEDVEKMKENLANLYTNIIDFYRQILCDKTRIREGGELLRRFSEIEKKDEGMQEFLARKGKRNLDYLINSFTDSTVSQEDLLEFLVAEEKRFVREQYEYQEFIQQYVDEFAGLALSERAKKYIRANPDDVLQRIGKRPFAILDSLSPDNEKTGGAQSKSRIFVRDDIVFLASKNPKHAAYLRHVIFHELVHLIQPHAQRREVWEPEDHVLAGILSPQERIVEWKTGLDYNSEFTTWLNEAGTELLASFLAQDQPVAYLDYIAEFWDMIDSGMTLELYFDAMFENPSTTPGTRDKAPRFAAFAKRLSEIEGNGALKRRAASAKKRTPEETNTALSRSLPE